MDDVATAGRRDRRVYALVAVHVVALLLFGWLQFHGSPVPFPALALLLIPPVTFLVLGVMGIATLRRMGRGTWGHPSAVLLWISTTLVLVPLLFYAFIAFLLTQDYSDF